AWPTPPDPRTAAQQQPTALGSRVSLPEAGQPLPASPAIASDRPACLHDPGPSTPQAAPNSPTGTPARQQIRHRWIQAKASELSLLLSPSSVKARSGGSTRS